MVEGSFRFKISCVNLKTLVIVLNNVINVDSSIYFLR